MKKFLIPATAAILLCGAIAGFMLKDENQPATTSLQNPANPVSVVPATTRQPEEFHPTFGSVNVPEQMKQQYTINPRAAQIITGNSGTMLLIPDNAFTDKSGNPVDGKVKLELVEGIVREDILTMNLGTMSEKGFLETGGMIYLNATTERGDTLIMANGKNIDVEIPTTNVKEGMQLWEGKENVDGSISWLNPDPIDKGLREIPVDNIDPSSQSRQDSAQKKSEVNNDFGDVRDTIIVDRVAFINGVAWQPGIWKVANGIWVRDTNSFVVNNPETHQPETINLNDKKFAHTNIATAEFRSRIPFIKQACDSRIMGCYTNHPNRPLWKSDLAAADTLEKSDCAMADLFRQFAKQKDGVVSAKDPNTAAALDKAREGAIKKYSKRVQQQQADFKSYSFGMKKLGWANIDRLSDGAKKMFFNAHVDAVSAGDEVKVSLMIPGRSIYIPGYKRPNGDYSFTHGESEQQANYPVGEEAYIVAKSGKDKNFKYAVKKIVLGTNAIESLALKAGTEADLARELGNAPPEKLAEEAPIIDDWYTKSMKSGSGCLCNNPQDEMGAMIGIFGFGAAK